MGCLKTDTCCCCFSLRTGGLILGWLGVIGGGLGAIAYLAIDPKKLPPSPLPEAYQTTPEMDLIRNSMWIFLRFNISFVFFFG